MVSLLKVLLRFFCILRSGKYHIKHFPRHWASLLTYLGRKLSEWRCSWSNEPGTFRKPKPTGPSFLGDSVGSCSMSSSPGGLSGFAFAASTVPSSSSANPQSAPQASPNPTTLSANPSSTPRTLSPNPTNQLIENSPAHRSSASIQSRVSASDRPSIISSTRTRNSRASSRASARSGQLQLTQRPSPRATHRQFGRGPSPLRDRSPESPSAIPSSYTAQPHYALPPSGYTHTNVDEGLSRSPSIGPQRPTYLPSLSSYSRRATSIGVNIQSPSTESLSNTSSTDIREFTEEPTTAGTSPRTISLADRSETASQHSQASSAPSLILPPEGCIVQLINSDQIPRYTKSATTQVDYSILAMLFLHILADPVRKNWNLWDP